MTHPVFSITGNKISSFIIDDNSLKFSSNNYNTYNDFQEGWDKKLSLATKVEVKYEVIKSIVKEDNDDDITINYKTFAGIPTNCQFSFTNKDDYEIFFNYFIEKKHFVNHHEALSPFKAIRNYLIGLVATIGLTIFTYHQAIEIQNGTVEESSSSKGRLFNNLVEFLGDKGVLLLGIILAGYLIYKIWTRFKNPPNQRKLLPQNS
ncbi:MAG: hypothetical protein V4548_11125 [Bacteroidota bacterium]